MKKFLLVLIILIMPTILFVANAHSVGTTYQEKTFDTIHIEPICQTCNSNGDCAGNQICAFVNSEFCCRCPQNTRPNSQGNCDCLAGMYWTDPNNHGEGCQKCPQNSVPNSDRTSCLCKETFIQTSSGCECPMYMEVKGDGKCGCKNGYVRRNTNNIAEGCGYPPNTKVVDGKIVCKETYTRIDPSDSGLILGCECPKNTDDKVDTCECKNTFVWEDENTKDKGCMCPTGKTLYDRTNTCVCNSGFHTNPLNEDECILDLPECPGGKILDEDNNCVCPVGLIWVDPENSCQTPKTCDGLMKLNEYSNVCECPSGMVEDRSNSDLCIDEKDIENSENSETNNTDGTPSSLFGSDTNDDPFAKYTPKDSDYSDNGGSSCSLGGSSLSLILILIGAPIGLLIKRKLFKQ